MVQANINISENPQTANNDSPKLIPLPGNLKIETLREIFQRHSGEKQLIILQDFPDPDALSSAWAYALIAEEYDIKCDIVYAGTLSHQENITLVKLTDLPLERLTLEAAKKKDLSEYQGCAFLDNQGTTSQLTPLARESMPVVAIIDHHKLQEDLHPEFADIRPSVKATATILTQYIQSGMLHFDSNSSDHIKCATALMHGLRSDTNQLRQATDEEFLAAAFLSRFYDVSLLDAILQSSRSQRVMDVIEKAISQRRIENNFSMAGVGYLRALDRDAIPQAADFLIEEENVHTAVVYGIVLDKEKELEMVVGSLRTNKITLDPDEFIKEAFGTDESGRFFGGGRSQAGGFEIPIGFLSGFNDDASYADKKWDIFNQQVKQKLLKLISPE